jgi:polyisoprenoid-binding protein YceI
MRRRTLFVGGAGLIVVVVVAAVGSYLHFFSGLRQAPKPFALSSPPASSGGSQAAANLAGRWGVQSGSQVGYRVHEQFVDQSAPHDAVARASGVSGGLTVQQSGSSLRATGISFTARLTDLHSVDQVAGRDVSSRDRVVSRSLSIPQYPDATFAASSVAIPASALKGQTVQLTVPGQLTVHGTTKPAQAKLQGRVSGSQLQLAGTVPVTMTDFGITPPQVLFVKVPPQATVEVQLALAKSQP